MAFSLSDFGQNPGGGNSGGSTSIATPAITVAAGELIVVYVRWEGGGANDAAVVSSVTDTIGNTYVVGPSRDNDSGGEGKKITLAYCLSSAYDL